MMILRIYFCTDVRQLASIWLAVRRLEIEIEIETTCSPGRWALGCIEGINEANWHSSTLIDIVASYIIGGTIVVICVARDSCDVFLRPLRLPHLLILPSFLPWPVYEDSDARSVYTTSR